jgi:SH3-like domain-containing protein
MQFFALLALILIAMSGPLAAQEARKPEHPARHHQEPKHPAPAHKPSAHHAAPAKPAPAAAAGTAPAATAPAAVPAPPPSATPAEPPKGSNTGLPLPRFASLKTDEVNLRSGPGLRYPIEWVYKRRDLPVEIQREFEVWRLVSDQEGVKGWVHQATLVGRRTFVSIGVEQVIRSSAEDTASAVARLKPGVIGRIRSCDAKADWCQVQVGEYRGWLKREAFWGTYPGEAIQ